MLDKLGAAGIVGIIVLLGGIGVIASQDPVIAGGFALVLVGLVLTVRALLKGVLSAMGMGGMF
jgi:hypothetical protein